jgi:putative nucleotidyltransferase with HDIG domain
MLTSENLNPNLVSHAVTVATLAVALAQKLGITDNTAMQNLGFGALLHDIGHMNQDYEIERPLDQFSKEELFNYHHHPQVAAARLTEKQPIDPVVLRIVQQHEERIDGSGFPNSLRGEQTDPLALMVSSCNAVDRLITFEKTPREVAIKKLLVEKVGLHPLEHIQGLQEILAEISRA